MNTKPIPIIITLLAAGVSCVISFLQGVDFSTFLVRLLLTVVFFYIVGIVVGILLFNAFPLPKEEKESSGDNNNTEEDTSGQDVSAEQQEESVSSDESGYDGESGQGEIAEGWSEGDDPEEGVDVSGEDHFPEAEGFSEDAGGETLDGEINE